MGKLRWYKRDPVAALEGMSNLTLEEVGAYNIVLDLIYARDGKVDDDDRFIAGWLRCDLRVWRRIRSRLIEVGKLYLADGSLRNSRADREVHRGLSMVASASEAGKASARKKRDVKRENNSLTTTHVPTTASTNSTTTTTSREEESSLRSDVRETVSRVEREQEKRATRLPQDWQPSVDDINFAKANGLDAAGVLREATKFTNYWLAKGGKDARKLDWSRTWQNWVLNSGGSGGQGRSRQLQDDSKSVSRAIERQQQSGIQFGPRPRLLPDDSQGDLRLLPARRGTGS